MKINNKYFGEIAYTAQETIYFPEGLFGFEEQKEFLPIPFEENSDTLICLQSLDEESLSFILLNPFSFFADYDPKISEAALSFILLNPFYFFTDYDPKISEADRSAIGSPADEDISYYVIGVIREELSDSTVNLKAPIAVNFHTRDARQIILEDPAYTFRHSLGEQKGKEE